jgi:hypothetical protein
VLIAERISVPGLTGKSAQATRGSERLSAASNARSARVGFGCRVCRRSIASAWRGTTISSSFERRGRASNQTSASTFRTARYANDQSKQPSRPDSKSAEPRWSGRGRTAGRVCDPTGGQGFDRLPLVDGKLVAGEPAPTGAWLLSGRVSD